MSAYIATQPHNLPLLITKESCAGKTYIITGANVGLGFEAAKHLAQLGAAKVILAVRNVSLGEAAKVEIDKSHDGPKTTEVWPLDLSSYDSVKAFAKRASTELDRIDALIENAGVAMGERQLAEGHVLSFTVNVMSTLLLAILLLPRMSEHAQKFNIVPHIAMISSGSLLDTEDLWNTIRDNPIAGIDDESMVALRTYPLSKLIHLLAMRQLATLVPVSQTGVVLNAACPGLCKTSLSRNAPAEFKVTLTARKDKYGRTAEDGSRTLLHAAVAGKESHGRFLSDCKIAEDRLSSWVTDNEGQKSQQVTWDAIAKELEVIEPGCLKAIQQI